jgi:hypothetical protein
MPEQQADRTRPKGLYKLKAASINVASSKLLLMTILASDELIDLLMVQEIPWAQIGRSRRWGTMADRNFLCVLPVSIPNAITRPHVAIYLRRLVITRLKIVTESRLDLIEDLNVMAIQLKFGCLKYQIWNVYIPPRGLEERCREGVLKVIMDPEWPHEAIIMGDINCTGLLWGDKTFRPEIDKIEDRITEGGFSVVTPRNAATWIGCGRCRTDAGSSIDVVLAGPHTRQLVRELVVDKVSYPKADHAMQRFTMYWGHNLEQEVLNVDKFDKSIFTETVKDLEALVSLSSIMKWDRIISGAVRAASLRVIPGWLASWWDNSLSTKRAEIVMSSH